MFYCISLLNVQISYLIPSLWQIWKQVWNSKPTVYSTHENGLLNFNERKIEFYPECCRNSSAVAAQCKFLTSKLSVLIERTEIEMRMKEAALPRERESVCVSVYIYVCV